MVVGILYAPRSGEETRQELRKRANGLLEQGRDEYDAQKERILEAIEAGKETAQDRTEELKSRISDTRDKLKSQVDTAADSAKDKINSATEKVMEIKDLLNEQSDDGAAE